METVLDIPVSIAQASSSDETAWLFALRIELARLYPPYAERALAVPERRELDWELCAHGLLSESDLVKAYAKTTGCTVCEEDELPPIEKFPEVSLEYLIHHACLPLSWDDSSLELLISDPYHKDSLAYLFKRLCGRTVSFRLMRRSIIDRLLNAIYSETQKEEQDGKFSMGSDGSEESLRNMASEAKIVRLVNEMFARAVEMGASDIHIEPEENSFAIRFRVDGILQEVISPPLSQFPAIASRIKLVGGMNIAESRLPQDGRTNIQMGRHDMDIRISTIPTMNGESIVLRILRKDSMDFDLKNVGMNAKMRSSFEKLITLPHGILLVVGPTGSGKTTTLYSVMSAINTPDKKIITIEDPVEYRTPRLSQIQVNPKIGLDFASGLRHIVRQDPDVILVGEIRDRETADIAIHAALTGHLVLSTLHTNDAPGAVSRLVDMGVDGFLISAALCGVLSQRLVRKICPQCGGSALDNARGGAKCRHCNGSGYKGRTGIFELLCVNEAIRAAISRNADIATITALALENGMNPIIEDGRAKVAEGITTNEELARAVTNI